DVNISIVALDLEPGHAAASRREGGRDRGGVAGELPPGMAPRDEADVVVRAVEEDVAAHVGEIRDLDTRGHHNPGLGPPRMSGPLAPFGPEPRGRQPRPRKRSRQDGARG